mgnify:FL=1
MLHRIKYPPNPCRSLTHEFCIAGKRISFVVSLFENGQPAGVQINGDTSGGTIDGFSKAWATFLSRLLQRGETLSWIVKRVSYTRFDPCGFTDNPKIPYATSIPDYIVRWMALEFGVQQPEENLKI